MIHTRFILITGIVAWSTAHLYAQTPQKLNIDEATVFLNGAELSSSAKINLVKGENEILFTNVAGDVNSQSLTVNATNGVVVEATTFQNNYLAAETFSPRAKDIKDSIELITENKGIITNKIAVLNEQVAILQGNRKVSGENTGLSVAELTKMLDLISSKMEGYLNQKNMEEALLKKADERLAKLKKQLDEEQKKDYQPGGQLLVKFYAKEATNSDVKITYIVPHAGWSATYDIMADDANSPIKLYYKANIYQNSGVKWNNVRLSLSTGNPKEGVQAPTMNPWYLAFYAPPVSNQGLTNNANRIRSDAGRNGIPENKNMQYLPGSSQGVEDLVALSPGMYQQKRGGDLSMGGARSDGTLYIVDGVQVRGNTSINNYVSVDNSGVSTTFDIDLPYTIPSDGQQHLVSIKKYEVPATYRYYAAPKIDKDAFLQAQITNWEDLNLLPGQTNIFYEGTYVGQGYMDVRNVKDTMTISLGRDKKIVIKRDQDKKLRSVKTVGTNIRETFAYTISIRNTRKETINLVLQDQQPVSNDKDLVIEDKNTGDSEYEETTGMMKWTLSLNANEAKNVNFGYTIKYPKGKTVYNLR